MNFQEYLSEKVWKLEGKTFDSLKAAAASVRNLDRNDDRLVEMLAKKLGTSKRAVLAAMEKKADVSPKKEAKGKKEKFVVVYEIIGGDSAIVGVCTNDREAKKIIAFRKKKTGQGGVDDWSTETAFGSSAGTSAYIAYTLDENPTVEFVLSEISTREKMEFQDDGYDVKKITLNKPLFIR